MIKRVILLASVLMVYSCESEKPKPSGFFPTIKKKQNTEQKKKNDSGLSSSEEKSEPSKEKGLLKEELVVKEFESIVNLENQARIESQVKGEMINIINFEGLADNSSIRDLSKEIDILKALNLEEEILKNAQKKNELLEEVNISLKTSRENSSFIYIDSYKFSNDEKRVIALEIDNLYLERDGLRGFSELMTMISLDREGLRHSKGFQDEQNFEIKRLSERKKKREEVIAGILNKVLNRRFLSKLKKLEKDNLLEMRERGDYRLSGEERMSLYQEDVFKKVSHQRFESQVENLIIRVSKLSQGMLKGIDIRIDPESLERWGPLDQTKFSIEGVKIGESKAVTGTSSYMSRVTLIDAIVGYMNID